MKPNQQKWRNGLLKMVHIAKRDLKMTDDQYRAMLSDRYEKDSAADLNMRELDNLIKHFEKLGVQFTKPRKPKANNKAADPQSKKIRALWLELHKKSLVRDPSDKALRTFVRRQTGVDSLEWLNTHQASLVIESLKKWMERAR